ncbi:hypothetical protein SM11_pD0690 (plasmid) [Sinorhizobium meliloti SM11]|uniref:Uncharacterized protein n=1 Tax=Sinorhizobium meliloti (strain SM11) TaxID=707241 RepID=F7XG46_SINMM|nr:hypothetical protein SM11_pD0690 [Sinorhizobium meliloti SM11]
MNGTTAFAHAPMSCGKMTEDVTETMSGTGTKPLGKSTRGVIPVLPRTCSPVGRSPAADPPGASGASETKGPRRPRLRPAAQARGGVRRRSYREEQASAHPGNEAGP